MTWEKPKGERDIETMNAERLEAAIQQAIAKHVDLDETFVFLFGSRAGEAGRLSSDYDVGLYQGCPIPLVTIAKIKDELEEHPMLVDVDIVDFAHVSDEFKRLALTAVKIWNRPKRALTLTSSC